MNVQYAGNPYMSRRLIEVIQELRDYLGPGAHGGLSDEDTCPVGFAPATPTAAYRY